MTTKIEMNTSEKITLANKNEVQVIKRWDEKWYWYTMNHWIFTMWVLRYHYDSEDSIESDKNSKYLDTIKNISPWAPNQGKLYSNKYNIPLTIYHCSNYKYDYLDIG